MKITFVKEDISTISSDIIVCPANPDLSAGSGVNGIIHRAAGSDLAKECNQLLQNRELVDVREILITDSYNLPCKKIFHIVGPNVYRGDDISLLGTCYRTSILLANQNEYESICFPPISVGIHGVTIEQNAQIVKESLQKLPNISFLKEIIFCFQSEREKTIYENTFSR